MKEINPGKKSDKEKLRWELLPIEEIEELVKVMTFGANKYNEDPQDPNWKKLDDGFNRYYAALMRHLVEVRKGNFIDEESGLKHMSCVIFNAIALSYFAKKEESKIKEKKEK